MGDEEGYGKFMDLHECYDKYINLKGIERFDYIQYIQNFDKLSEIPKEKKNAEYKAYLSTLIDYLYSFINRTKPLLALDEQLTESTADLDLSAFSTPEDMAS